MMSKPSHFRKPFGGSQRTIKITISVEGVKSNRRRRTKTIDTHIKGICIGGIFWVFSFYGFTEFARGCDCDRLEIDFGRIHCSFDLGVELARNPTELAFGTLN